MVTNGVSVIILNNIKLTQVAVLKNIERVKVKIISRAIMQFG